jgi:hypothetical protein
MLMGFRSTHLLYVAAELDVADRIRNRPRSSVDLAAELGANPDALHRVLRALAQLGVLRHEPNDTFSLTPIGECLRSDRPDSLGPIARFYGHEMIQRAWGNMLHTVMTGEIAFDHLYGLPAFDYLEEHPEAAEVYHRGMAQIQAAATPAVVFAYDFGTFGTIVDVGGGNGSLIAAILRAYPVPRGIVADLPNARPAAEATIQTAGIGERARFEPIDFFAAVPAGGDGYLLRRIIHDWAEEPAVTILKRCRRAIPPHGRLLVIELLLPEASEPGLEETMIDVTMMVRAGGRERTEAEYRALLSRAGFQLDQVIPTGSPLRILECRPS